MRLIDADALFDAIQSMLVARALGESDETIYDVVKHAPTVQMESLTARITELEQKLAHKTYHCQANLDELKRTIRMLHDKEQEFKKLESKKFAKFDNEECWIYQGDGYDNLESLACPVVINPNVLINLINSPTVQREGWVSVPIEPTWEMTNNASENTDVNSFIDINNVWQAMIQAAPALRELNEVKPHDMPAPYDNCQFKHCDLRGQCLGEGKCHYPIEKDN